MKNYIALTFTLFLTIAAFSQVPSPAGPQQQPILLKGASIHTGNGNVVENGLVAFDKGVLTFVGSDEEFEGDEDNYTAYDVHGQHIYPGLIMLNSVLGLNEVNSLKATIDYNEVGDFTPNIRSIVAYNTDSERIPNNRSNGILIAQIVPRGGTVSGSSSVVQLDAWNWEDAMVKVDEGIHFFWPNKYIAPKWYLGETEAKPNKKYPDIIRKIEKDLIDARAYRRQPEESTTNLKLKALEGLFDGSATAYIHVDKAVDIIKSIQLMQKCQVEKIVLVGASDAVYVADFISKNRIPVIVSSTHSLPSREDENVDNPYKLPSLLVAEDITVAIASYNNDNMSNLPFSAGTAAAYGLSKEEALKLLTINAAKILGIDDLVGSIEKGKRATLVVSKGDLLDMSGNDVQMAFIDGREIDLDNKHKKLYRKFKAKYE